MTKRRICIISHSSIDLVSTLNHYERYRDECDVTIISPTDENLQFLRAVNIPNSALKSIPLASTQYPHRRHLVGFLHRLRADKHMLDELAREISRNRTAEVIFHSYDNDPYSAYLVSQIARTNTVTLVDVLGIKRRRLTFHQLLTVSGVKNLIYLALVSAVFGRLFMLSGTRSYPILSLDLDQVNVLLKPKSAGGTMSTLAKYRYPPPVGGKIAFVLYADSFGVSDREHESAYRSIVDRLARHDFQLLIKVHPQSQPPQFLDDYEVHYLPKYVPFEFIDLVNVCLVVGLSGASLLCPETVPTVSILPMVYDENSDYYKSAMVQLSQNEAITFVGSVDEFEQLIGSLQ